MLKDDFVCGVRDISNKKYAGVSGKHAPDGNAIDTTNGAGPHNIQMFVMTPDGVVLHCLPGYWHSQDLAQELRFAQDLNHVWQDQSLTRAQKDNRFREMQLRHVWQHTVAMRNRSKLQGFDAEYEVDKRYFTSDAIANRNLINPQTKEIYPGAMKTTDVLMHERMSQRPFAKYKDFDVAAYSDYGKQKYDKEEDFRDHNGKIIAGSDPSSEKLIGNDPRAHPVKTQTTKLAKQTARNGLKTFLRYGLKAALR